jgi:HEAT repeat protein
VHTSRQSSPFSLFNRLKVETIDHGAQVPLNSLFDERKDSGGRDVRPKRILIQGRAGVGKSTLCKKIVYEYLHNGMWKHLFERVLWVPLHKLKLRTPQSSYNMRNLFYDEYFSQYQNGEHLAEAMWRSIEESFDHDKTLFILDGLDEVSHKWCSGAAMDDFLNHLLRQPKVIITTRPHTLNRNDLEPLDLELETIGFRPEQVTAYVNNTEKESAEQIHTFIRSHQLIQGLVRIPIQLDALCYGWKHDSFLQNELQTMTMLYQAIELNLWKKDICRLEKKSANGELLTEKQVRNLGTNKIKRLVQHELKFLECLAFSGLYNNFTDFNSNYRDLVEDILLSTEREVPDDILGKVSFLRTSDSSTQKRDKTYHFLHLTFQEYFAASYFVAQWIEEGRSLCLVTDGNCETIKPNEFLQKEKYNGRFDIFWRFVAGLLHSRHEKHLLHFFQMLNNEPRDLLGPSHQRLLMHCFSEVPIMVRSPNMQDLRARIEDQSKKWALFEYELQGEMRLCSEMEFPEHVLHTMIKEESEGVKKAILIALGRQPHLSSHLLDQVAFFLGQDTESSAMVRWSAISALRNQTTLPENILQAVVSRLEDTQSIVRQSAINVLRKQTALPEDILQAVVSRLEHTKSKVRQSAVDALGNRPSLPEDILQAVVSRLEDTESEVRQSAIDALGNRPNLPEDILQAVMSRLEDTESEVRESAINALGNQTTLPEDILQAIVSRLEDTDPKVRQSAVDALGNRPSLSEDILQAVVSRLEHTESEVRQSAVDILGNQTTLPEDFLQAMVSRLEHTSPVIRQSAIDTLGSQIALLKYILQAMVSRLEHTESEVRWCASNTLRNQINLPGDILQAVVSRLEHTDSVIRRSAIDALGNRPSLSEDILQAVVSRLKDTESDVRWSTVDTLRNQTSLSEHILQAIVPQLEDTEFDVRQSAVDALGNRPSLPEKIVQALGSRLKDTKYNVRQSAINALGNQTTLPKNILQTMVSQLRDSESEVTQATIYALRNQTTLPEDFLQAVVSRLEHTNPVIRQSAIDTLHNQITLRGDILQAVVSRLEHTDSVIRRSAIDVLGNQTTLSERILQAVVSQLKDTEYNVRQSAINALGNQTTLPEKIIQALAKFVLSNSNSNLHPQAVHVLLKQDNLYANFFNFDMKTLQSFYEILLHHSFKEQLSCYMQDGTFYIDMPDRRREIPLVLNKKDFQDAFQIKALALGSPISSLVAEQLTLNL